MTYRELQKALREFRNASLTTIKLNRKKVELQAEYDRIMTIKTEVKESYEPMDVDYYSATLYYTPTYIKNKYTLMTPLGLKQTSVVSGNKLFMSNKCPKNGGVIQVVVDIDSAVRYGGKNVNTVLNKAYQEIKDIALNKNYYLVPCPFKQYMLGNHEQTNKFVTYLKPKYINNH